MVAVSVPKADLAAIGLRLGLFGAVLLVSAMPARADVTSQSKRTENKDGSTSMVFSSEVADLGAKVGVTVTEPAADSIANPLADQEAYGGSAFARVTAKDLPSWMIWQKSTVDVTVDPADESSKVATTFSRTVTVNSSLKATLSDTYAVERSGTSETWETNKSLSVKFEDTATTLSVATKATEDTDRWMPSVSASQQIMDGLKVTTTVADTGSDLNKSLTASFTRRW